MTANSGNPNPGNPNSGDTNPGDRNLRGQPSDDELLALLRAGQAEVDPPPPGLAEMAMRALTWDTEFAALVTATPVDEPVLVRGAEGATGLAEADVVDLTFEIEGTVLEVSVESKPASEGYRLSGLIHPVRDQVLVITPGVEPVAIECDSFGRFEAEVMTEPLALGFELAHGRVVRTELLDLP
ncbi:MAG: hypothetical protein OER95_08125 [Acidimicrobiia bacterium]|nr:hypothetical protein [Acidimicrobiia bacterium]